MMESEILLSLWPVILFNCYFLFTLIIFVCVYRQKPKDSTIPVFTYKTFLGLFFREYAYWASYPLFYLFVKLKFTPNVITLTAPFLALISGYYYYKGNFAVAGWILAVSGVFDFMDGRLARATNQISKEGAFLDSNLDRYSDGIIFSGIALYYRDNLFMLIVSILSIIGPQITSYSKARGELNGVSVNIGIMQRAERYVLLWIASIFHPFIMILLNRHGITVGYPMIIALILMAVLTNYTAIVRIIYSFRQICRQSGKQV